MPSVPIGESLSVVFPAYMEEQLLSVTVGDVLDGLRQWSCPFEILIVENGSKDRTRAVAEELATAHAEVRALSMPAADYGRALREGLLQATGTYVANFDVDLYDLDFLDRALARMTTPGGPSIIVATKRGEGAVDTRHWTRRVVTGVFSTMLRVGFHLRVSDTHGMKVMRRADVVDTARSCLFGTDLFDTELIIRSERMGLTTDEIGVTIEEKRPARTPIVGRIVRSLRGLVRLWLALRKEQRQGSA